MSEIIISNEKTLTVKHIATLPATRNMNGDHLRVMGFMNVHSSISSKEFGKGAVPAVIWNKQNPATPL